MVKRSEKALRDAVSGRKAKPPRRGVKEVLTDSDRNFIETGDVNYLEQSPIPEPPGELPLRERAKPEKPKPEFTITITSSKDDVRITKTVPEDAVIRIVGEPLGISK